MVNHQKNHCCSPNASITSMVKKNKNLKNLKNAEISDFLGHPGHGNKLQLWIKQILTTHAFYTPPSLGIFDNLKRFKVSLDRHILSMEFCHTRFKT